MNIKELAGEQKEYIRTQRRFFHAHPEVSKEEAGTTEHIVRELEAMGIPVRTFDDCTGAVGTIEGTRSGGEPGSGKTVMLRADIDALPITEPQNKEYSSQNPGVMHACGHDCHMAMLLAAAKILSSHRDEFSGTVKLLFQMGEEVGIESKHYVDNGALDGVDAIFGMHVWALLDSGCVNFEDGERMASSDRFTIRIKGCSSHGSAPHEGKDAVVGAAAVVMALQTLVSRINNPQNTFVLSVGMMNGGTQSNILAGQVELVGTTRTFNREFRKSLPKLITDMASGVAVAYGCEAETEYCFFPGPVINDHEDLNNIARSAAEKQMGKAALVHLDKMTGAEDFSVLMEKVPGVYGFLGVRNREKGICCVHHHPDFEVDEEQLPNGTGIYVQFAIDYLNG
ncbi:amidohydrolase [uncultured Clostridium sp.]|uniref:amidohydrolase n=1 Tax=uncultured Clostridium sp. TaxID=59620 RepID=UPI0025DE007E|nr:amidohydrolase [uncultured Clostridium sp.]